MCASIASIACAEARRAILPITCLLFWLAGWLVCWIAGLLACWLAGLLACWLAVLLAVLVGWFCCKECDYVGRGHDGHHGRHGRHGHHGHHGRYGGHSNVVEWC